MRQSPLGAHGPSVSVLGLGSTDWGAATSEAAVHRLLDIAFDAGITLIDTAEVYPVPFSAETYGVGERVIGNWLRTRHAEGRVIIATKILSHGSDFPWVRDGMPRLDRRNIETAVDGSLSRLGINTIDLYQLHWPARRSNHLGTLDYYDAINDDAVPLEETLGVLADLVRVGKIRHVGLCNETPWGVMHALHLAETRGLPRIVAIQNPYNLLNRTFEIGLAEVAMREAVPLLAYSPLAHGTLSGKYLGGILPAGSRFMKYPFFRRYRTERAEGAVAAYVGIAHNTKSLRG